METIFSLMDTVPGAFFSHLSVTFVLLGVFIVLTGTQAQSQKASANRMLLGIGLLLGLRLLLFVFALLMAGGILKADLLPPLERGAGLIGLAIAVWIWSFPDPDPQANWAVMLSSIFFGLITILGSLLWLGQAGQGQTFSGHWIDQIAVAISILAALSGLTLLLIRQPSQWVFGAVFFLIILFGEIFHYFLPRPASNYATELRLVQIAAFPLFFSLPLRIRSSRLSTSPTSPQPAVYQTIHSRKKYNLQPNLMELFVRISPEEPLQTYYEKISHILAYGFVSDLCFFIAADETSGDFIIPAGYDLILEKSIQVNRTSLTSMPLLHSALQKGSSLRLQTNTSAKDLAVLGKTLGVDAVGNLLLAPIKIQKEGYPQTAIGLYSPYSKRAWDVEEQGYLERINYQLAETILQKISVLEAGESAPADYSGTADLEGLINELTNKNEALQIANQEYQEQLEKTSKQATLEHRQSETVIQQLNAELEQLKRKPEKSEPPVPAATNGVDRKTVNLNGLIDSAIAQIQDQIRKKNLILRVDIPAFLPDVTGERVVFQRVLDQLLQNAAEVTPSGQEIGIQASLAGPSQKETKVHLSITDSGAGISVRDLSKIFDTSQNQNIRGLGSPASELPDMKTKITANSGKIWAESTINAGTTFHLLLHASPGVIERK